MKRLLTLILAGLTWLWRGPQIKVSSPSLRYSNPHIGPTTEDDERERHDNTIAIMMADLHVQRQGLQHTITVAHRSMIIAYLALLITIYTLTSRG